ncbi:MAG: hypothetical protein UX43_C0013G0001 [Candidatus Giovannonibacteria bacterium GW2011_GWB1_46_20]|nr:MAG: hypothetical protein UX43_C0013G0001 [Candidatus Giovannonibacteria bacterium GW2011_GWB1_46_20]
MYVIVGAVGGIISNLVLRLYFRAVPPPAISIIAALGGGLLLCVIVAKLVGDL